MLLTTLLLTTPMLIGTGPENGRGAGDAVFLNARHTYAPGVAVWTNRDEIIRSGQSVRVFFETEFDAFVTVFRIDTDGRVEVLFPQGPWDNNFARGGRRYEAQSYGARHAFRGDPFPGEGYLLAVTSPEPFHYAALAHGTRWDYRELGYQGRVVGDPYVAVTDLIDLIVPVGYEAYDYDVAHYYVERRVDYPRFLCYDCHAYASYADWNPYHDPCFRFRIVVYNDPYYYPLRAYGGAQVVFTRPKRLEPRFVFVERAGTRPDLVVESRRPVNDPGPRRTADRAATSRQFGGVGVVPTPRRRGPTGPDARRDSGSGSGREGTTPVRRRVERQPAPEGTAPPAQAAPPRLVPRRANPAAGTRRPTDQGSPPAATVRPTPRRLQPAARPDQVPRAAGRQPQPAPVRRSTGPDREERKPARTAGAPSRRTDPRPPPRRRP